MDPGWIVRNQNFPIWYISFFTPVMMLLHYYLLMAEEWKHETVCTVTDKWNNKLEQRITEFTWKITQKKKSSLFWHYFDRIKREYEYFISNVQPWYIIQILFKASLDSLDLVFRSISKVIELCPLELEDLQTSDLFFMQKQQITFS